MASERNEALARFLTAQQPAIARLVGRAYQEAGGHYADLSVAARREQADITLESFGILSVSASAIGFSCSSASSDSMTGAIGGVVATL